MEHHVMGIDEIIDELSCIGEGIYAAARAVAKAETALAEEQYYGSAEAEDDYELVVAMATMEAYANDVAYGKNQSQRDVQLAAYLGNHAEVKAAKLAVRQRSVKVAGLKVEADAARRDYSIAANRLWALRAMAELHAARLNAAAGVAYKLAEER